MIYMVTLHANSQIDPPLPRPGTTFPRGKSEGARHVHVGPTGVPFATTPLTSPPLLPQSQALSSAPLHITSRLHSLKLSHQTLENGSLSSAALQFQSSSSIFIPRPFLLLFLGQRFLVLPQCNCQCYFVENDYY